MSLEIALHAIILDLPWLAWVAVSNPANLFILASLYIFAFKKKEDGLKKFGIFVAFFISVSAAMEMLRFPFFATALPLHYMAVSIFLGSMPEESFVKRNMKKINLGILFGIGFLLA